MGFIRQVFGRLPRSSRRQHDEPEQSSPPTTPRHALDTLPTLPNPRRPITPTISLQPPSSSSGSSPFFKLPPELRQQIYRLVLAHHEIHLDMRYTAVETITPHSTRGASFDFLNRRWRWRASICHRHPDAQPIADSCGWGGPPPTACRLFESSCGIGREVLGLLLSCRLVYREAVEVVYGENLFHVSTGSLVLYTDRLLPPERAGAVTSLVYQVTEESVWDYAAEHLGIEPGLAAYEVLLKRLPRAFPSLSKLLVVVQGSLERGRVWRNGELALLDPDAVRECLLSSMDAVVGGFRRPLVECVVAMRHTAFDRLMWEERGDGERVESREGVWLQVWRPLIVVRDGKSLETGYWVRRVSPVDRTAFDTDVGYNGLPPTLPIWMGNGAS